MDLTLLTRLSIRSESKIVILVIDGLGGLPRPETGKSELETADTPNLNGLASQGICGLIDPVAPGITPGSGPGHLAIFGYDPIEYDLGRGVLEATGIDFDLKENDVAARGNFATIDEKGVVTDRRAGRISTDRNAELCRLLDGMEIDGAAVAVKPIKEHRFLAVFRGQGLSTGITDTDPQHTGIPAREASAVQPDAKRTAQVVNQFVSRARDALSGHSPANMVLLRGFSRYPNLPSMSRTYKLTPGAVAIYPMYRGLSKLVGMEVLEAGKNMREQFESLRKNYQQFDFLFLHVKHADSSGEDGDFDHKVKVIEEVDGLLPMIKDLGPDVLVVTGDHSTPAMLKSHSWHPVPFMLVSKWCRTDQVKEFSESACVFGGLGRFPALHVMPLAMANALKLQKFGA
jgi:2,3-bisphosphoglycerate-independent phosphoglycerate mutase